MCRVIVLISGYTTIVLLLSSSGSGSLGLSVMLCVTQALLGIAE